MFLGQPVEMDDDGPQRREDQVADGFAETREGGLARVPEFGDEDADAYKTWSFKYKIQKHCLDVNSLALLVYWNFTKLIPVKKDRKMSFSLYSPNLGSVLII